MAYYAPFYRPSYYPQQTGQDMAQYNPTFQPTMQPNIPQPTPQPMTQQGGNGLIWVQGETGAKSYLVAPGNTIMLMDSEGERFYLKSADASGMPLPLRVFEYKEVTNAPTNDFKGSTSDFPVDDDKYVTRDEFERRLASIVPQGNTKKTKNKLTEDADNGEQSV